MRICHHCHTHNLDLDNHCHSCERSLSTPAVLPWKAAILLGVVSTGCVDDKYAGEPEYGVAIMDMDGDGFYEDSDCDDNDPNVGEPSTWYSDNDGDGFGNSAIEEVDCNKPDFFVENSDDCDDSDATVYPGNNDENGTLCVLDQDGDGFGEIQAPLPYDPGTDCNDQEVTINPNATETAGDSIDSNCDGDDDT